MFFKKFMEQKSIAQKHNSFLGQDIVGLCCITYEYAKTKQNEWKELAPYLRFN